MGESKNPVKRLLEFGEEKFQDAVDELMSNPRFAEALGQSIERGVRAKGQADKGMRLALNLVNLPARQDYDDLVRRVMQLGEEVSWLETRLDAVIGKLDALVAKAAGKKAKTKARK